MEFENLARKTIETECEDYYFGIADLSTAQKSETQKYGSLLDAYPNAISIGLTIFPRIPTNHIRANMKKFIMTPKT